MCFVDIIRYICGGEEQALVERCVLQSQCIPHIRHMLHSESVCELCGRAWELSALTAEAYEAVVTPLIEADQLGGYFDLPQLATTALASRLPTSSNQQCKKESSPAATVVARESLRDRISTTNDSSYSEEQLLKRFIDLSMSEATQASAATQAGDTTDSKAESCLQLSKPGSTAEEDESDADSVIGSLGGNSFHGTIPFFGQRHKGLTDTEFTFAVSTSDNHAQVAMGGRDTDNGQPAEALATRSASIQSMGNALATSTGTPDDIEAEECKRLIHRTIFNFIESQDLTSALLSPSFSKRPANSPVPGSESPRPSPIVVARLREVYTRSTFEIQRHYCRICDVNTSDVHLWTHWLFVNRARTERMLPYGQASLDAVMMRPNESEQSLGESNNHRQDLYKAVVERTIKFLKRNDLLDAIVMETLRCGRYGALERNERVIHRSPEQHTEIVQRMDPTLPFGWQTCLRARQNPGDRHSALQSSINGRGREIAASIQHRSKLKKKKPVDDHLVDAVVRALSRQDDAEVQKTSVDLAQS